MFHSKTEPFDEQDNEFYKSYMDHTTLPPFSNTEIALAKALENITELQENLSFMIEYNSQLKAENDRLKISQDKTTSFINSEITKKEK